MRIKKPFLTLIICFAALVLIGGILCAAKIWKPFSAPKGNVEAVSKAIERTFQVNSLKTNGKIHFSARDEEKSAFIESIFSQKSEELRGYNPKIESVFNLSIGSAGITLRAEGKLAVLGNDVYINLTSLPASSSLLFGADLSKIKGKWYKINREEVAGITGININSETEKEREKLKELEEKAKAIICRGNIFQIEKNLGTEMIKGVKTTHYVLAFSKDGFKKSIPELLKTVAEYIPEDRRQEYDQNLQKFLDDFSQNFDELWKTVSLFRFDLWADRFVRRVKLEKTFSSTQNFSPKLAEGNIQAEIKIDLYFSDFGKKFNINPPKEYKKISDMLLEITGGAE